MERRAPFVTLPPARHSHLHMAEGFAGDRSPIGDFQQKGQAPAIVVARLAAHGGGDQCSGAQDQSASLKGWRRAQAPMPIAPRSQAVGWIERSDV